MGAVRRAAADHQQHAPGTPGRADPVGDDDQRGVRPLGEGPLGALLGPGIEMAGRLVEQDERGV
jgi:hypothetical protein